MIAFFRRLFSRKPKPPTRQPIACDLYMQERGEDWSLLGRYRTQDKAHDAAEIHAATVCMKRGDVVFFNYRYEPVYDEETKL